MHHPERLRDGPFDVAATTLGDRCQRPNDEETIVESRISLRCRECGRLFEPIALHVCDFCFGPLEVAYDYDAISETISRSSIEAGPRSMWRYHELLPVGNGEAITLGAGFTPLVKADRLGAVLGLKNLWVKNDTANPTGSFKDRVVSVALTKARQLGFTVAAWAATELAKLEAAKIMMTAVYGGTVVAVEGTYDDVNRLCAELTSEHPSWAFVNVNVRSYYAEGSKTLAFETAEQLGWQAPDHVVVPIASGSQLTKIKKGFDELVKVGLIDSADVRISGAQAAGCSPVATAFAEGTDDIRPVKPDTIAKSLAIGNPADGYYALKVIEQSGGGCAAVTDAEILDGISLLARTEGIFAETAGGVTIASLKKLVENGTILPDERVVVMVTGHGLKTVEALSGTVGPTVTIKPTLAAFDEALAGRSLSPNQEIS